MTAGKEPIQIGFLADRREEVHRIAEWFYLEWSFMYPGWTVRNFIRMISRRTNRDRLPLILVACQGEEPVGTVSLKRHDRGAPARLGPWITSLYVREDSRRKGIGRMLMSAAEEKAFHLGIQELFLMTYRLEPFYRRLGWTELDRADHDGYVISIMSKRLKQP